jgi:hypothetical protein
VLKNNNHVTDAGWHALRRWPPTMFGACNVVKIPTLESNGLPVFARNAMFQDS